MPDELTIDSGALIFATLADVYLSSGMVDEAISILKDGLSRNPTYTLAKVILGRAYYIKGDIKEAIKILEGTYKEAKDSEDENLYLGHCYKKLGDYDKAVEYYEVTLKVNPENKEAKQGLEELRPEPVKVEEKVEAVPEPAKKEMIETAPGLVEAEEKLEPAPVVKEKKKVIEAVAIPELPKDEKKVVAKPQVVIPLESLDKPIKKLLGVKTVKGSFICSKDGLLIKNFYDDRSDIEEMCAMIAAIYNEAEEAFKFLKKGSVEKFIIEKGDETICVITAGDSLLTVITQPEAKPGLVFVYARKMIDEIREILG